VVTYVSEAQTRQDSSKVKTYKLPASEDFNTWDVGAQLGLNYPRTDISGTGFNGFAFGLDVTKFLSHTFALQGKLIHGKLKGVDLNRPQYTYNSTINYDLTLNVLFQVGNISFLKRVPNLAFYGSIGFGVIRTTPRISLNGGGTELPGIYSQYTQAFDTMNYQKSTAAVVPYSVGAKYRINDKISVTGEYSFRTTTTDKLDGFFKLLSEEDDYSFLSIGITYHLGSKDKVLEWVNPMEIVYSDLTEMNYKMELVGKDSDGDGVADMYDKEPSTPKGSKVYGDGTSVDTDSDGVPDVRDAELLSVKNAKVDANGKEIKVETVPVVVQPEIKKEEVVSKPPTALTKKKAEEAAQTERLLKAIKSDFPSVFYEPDASKFPTIYYPTLESIDSLLKAKPNAKIRIIGNCDSKGSRSYNLALGKKRAETIKRYMIKYLKIEPGRLITETMGKDDPVDGGHYVNRRVDFIIVE
jgi:OOP family OmpA-OmpF porin